LALRFGAGLVAAIERGLSSYFPRNVLFFKRRKGVFRVYYQNYH